MFSKKLSLVLYLFCFAIDYNECSFKGYQGLTKLKPRRMKYQPVPPCETTPAPTTTTTTTAPTTTTPPTTSAPTPAPTTKSYQNNNNNYGMSPTIHFQNMMSHASGHSFQPLLVILVPVPVSQPQPPLVYTTTSAPTTNVPTTPAPTTEAPTTTEMPTTEEYGYAISSYRK
jgi:hypothetical protein